MKSLITLTLLSLTFCLWSCYPVYNLNQPAPIRTGPPRIDDTMHSKPGSCYAKCLMPPEMRYDTLNLAVYTKEDHQTNTNVNTRTIITTPANTMWVKKKASVNCYSNDPNDCLVWCLVEVPAIVETHHVLNDTIGSNDYKMKQVLVGEILNSGETEWREVLCQTQAEATYPQLSEKFAELNFLDRDTEDKKLIKAALVEYQRANNLPIGNFDFETLDALGILY